MKRVEKKNPGQPEFIEAVRDMTDSIWDLLQEKPAYLKENIIDRITEPERVVMFRVPWTDDTGGIQVNRGYRVQFNSAIGPYKGGTRFHPSVNLDVLKFLAFEQTFKNSLTTLPLGGGKGGADFDVKGRSDMEVMRFCQSFMTELYRHIGKNRDVPAGDIGVGEREIGFMYGQYKRLQNEFDGTVTGKGIGWGGSRLRMEATGYGVIYFLQEMLKYHKVNLKGKRIAVSGSGNVAQFTVEKALQKGAKVITLSDSEGTVVDHDGVDEEKLNFVMDLKNVRRGRIREYAERYGVEFLENRKPWGVKCDIAIPCATENELSAEDADLLVANGCLAVVEGANKPSTPGAVDIFQENRILYATGKAANAGGVAVSGLEMSQNGMYEQWSRKEVDTRLLNIMKSIHDQCVEYGGGGDRVNYVRGANIAGFIRVADAMLSQGAV